MYGFSHPQNIMGPHFRHHTYVICVHVDYICTLFLEIMHLQLQQIPKITSVKIIKVKI